VLDEHGTLRFKENKIVRHLLDAGPFDMNDLARLDFPREDREQFAQLIGYSLDGFCELPYVSDEVFDAADHMHKHGKPEDAARAAVLRQRLQSAQELMREGVAQLYGMHPDDLNIDAPPSIEES
jgi:hypothetical protein